MQSVYIWTFLIHALNYTYCILYIYRAAVQADNVWWLCVCVCVCRCACVYVCRCACVCVCVCVCVCSVWVCSVSCSTGLEPPCPDLWDSLVTQIIFMSIIFQTKSVTAAHAPITQYIRLSGPIRSKGALGWPMGVRDSDIQSHERAHTHTHTHARTVCVGICKSLV